jgi:S1-C subfamily serine protease
LDAAIVVAAALAGLGGWRFGFLARVFAWCGVAVALLLGVSYLPEVVTNFGGTNTDGRVTVAVLFLAVVATLGHAGGLAVGALAHRRAAPSPLPRWDRLLGAAIGVCGVVVILWMLIPSLAAAPGWPARQSRGSAIVGVVEGIGPGQPEQFELIGRAIANAPYPPVVDPVGVVVDPGPPPEHRLRNTVEERVRASIVKVSARACDRDQTGSGWVSEGGVVVTNAHVVAGARTTRIEDAAGVTRDARVVAYDLTRDLAVLTVPGLDAPGLPLGDGAVADEATVFGHPGGGPLRLIPARISQHITARIRHGADQPVERDVFVLAATVAPGDSGGALVDRSGVVLGVAFGFDRVRADVSYAITTTEVREALAAAHPEASVSTGRCLVP